ncbi:tyrosyl-tRNA synthetase [Coemansia javaensis]|uniref:Tyrosine--tRNA ligase n=1 Tax=Coemansia javaensis TaxID=2761396 RepID=A0A9W8HPQ1_9FUNG|nr:tyrosyl-tRNA synthetase [Coemansia javaensis]
MRRAPRLRIQRRGVHGSAVETLRARGLVQAVTSDAIGARARPPAAVYCGVDPTAESLHLGNMVTLMGLLHFRLAGHRAIPLVGSATGMIGDPSGRSTERTALDGAVLARNIAGIEAQLARFFERGTAYALRRVPGLAAGALGEVRVLHNADWYRGMGALDFLGDVGRHVRVGAMLARDSVKSRLQSPQGISFTEFAYQLLQAYDFWHLYRNHGCRIQLGGSDQWGNITAGTDLIHRLAPASADKDPAFGLTIPLLTTASGEKFGKSAGNAVWLDEAKTSPFDVYQFLVKTADADVERLLKMLTLVPLPRIAQTMDEHRRAPDRFAAQRLLAAEVTELVHGEAGVQQALCATEVLFGGRAGDGLRRFTAQDFASAFARDARMASAARAAVAGKTIGDIAVLVGACKSKSEAARLARGGGLYWNSEPVLDAKWVPSAERGDYLGDGTVGVVRTGKTNYHLLRLVD